jgi:hypothetical protein
MILKACAMIGKRGLPLLSIRHRFTDAWPMLDFPGHGNVHCILPGYWGHQAFGRG